MPETFPVVTSEQGTRYRIVAIFHSPDGLHFDTRVPDDYQCDLAKCDRPATYKDEYSQFCSKHEPWPEVAVHAD